MKSPTAGKSLVFISNFQQLLIKCCEVVICSLCRRSVCFLMSRPNVVAGRRQTLLTPPPHPPFLLLQAGSTFKRKNSLPKLVLLRLRAEAVSTFSPTQSNLTSGSEDQLFFFSVVFSSKSASQDAKAGCQVAAWLWGNSAVLLSCWSLSTFIFFLIMKLTLQCISQIEEHQPTFYHV